MQSSRFHRALLSVIMTVGGVAIVRRFALGLGASTNLSDAFPWGLWIGFDMLVGVATSAGSFAIAFAVYILRQKRYAEIARGAVLTAFLGYSLAVIALLIDLGRPWNIWHPVFYPNPRSVMFEVAWCVMLYTTVLAVELAPEILGALGLRALGEKLHRAMPFFAGLGLLLSTLHQSSLGGLFLIVPGKLHPYWSTPMLPVLFFASAVCCGFAMVIVENSLSHFGFQSRLETKELMMLAKGLLVVLIVRAALQCGDLLYRGVSWSGSEYERNLLILEIFIGTALPFLLLAFRGFRVDRVLAAGILTVGGVMLNRLNVSITGLESFQGHSYVPSWEEIAVTVALIAAGVTVFRFSALWLGLLQKEEGPQHPLWDRASLAAIAAAGIAAILIATDPGEVRAERIPADEDAAVDTGARVGRNVVISDSWSVIFPHSTHSSACGTCHPALYSMLGDRRDTSTGHATSRCGTCHNGSAAFSMTKACGLCHRIAVDSTIVFPQMQQSPGAVRFPHQRHIDASDSCLVCHEGLSDKPWREAMTMKSMREGKSCGACHNGRVSFGLNRCANCHGT